MGSAVIPSPTARKDGAATRSRSGFGDLHHPSYGQVEVVVMVFR